MKSIAPKMTNVHERNYPKMPMFWKDIATEIPQHIRTTLHLKWLMFMKDIALQNAKCVLRTLPPKWQLFEKVKAVYVTKLTSLAALTRRMQATISTTQSTIPVTNSVGSPAQESPARFRWMYRL